MIEALISGEAARVVFIEGNDVEFIEIDNPTERIRTRRCDIAMILDGASDVQCMRVRNREEIYGVVLEKYNFDRALRMLDLVISDNYSETLRLEAAEAFERIASQGTVLDKIKNIVFSTPNKHLPISDAIAEQIKTFPILSHTLEALSASQVHIMRFSEALTKALNNQKLERPERDQFIAKAVEGGVFRGLVDAKSDGQKVNSAILSSYITLKDVPRARSIVQDWTRDFLERRTKKQLRQLEAEEEQFDDQDFVGTSPLERTRHELYLSAKTQQRAIVARLRANDLASARRFANQLVSFQLQNGDAEYAAMSLSNIANEARKLGQHSIELEWAKMATELAPNDGYAFGGLADTYLGLFRIQEATEAFQKAIEKGEEEFGTTGLARTLRATGKLEEALVAFDEARRKYAYGRRPQYAWSGYSETLRELGRFDEALASYEEATKLFTNEANLYCGKAAVLSDVGRISEAKDIYHFVISKFPDDPIAYCGLAECLKQQGQFSEAVEQFDRAIAKFPDNEFAICGRADVLRAMGQFGAALEAYREAKQRLPFEPLAYSGYAETLRDMGEYKSAIDAYADAVERFPLDARTRSAHANALKASRRYAAALQAYDANVKDFPQHLINRVGRASMLKQLGRYEDALAAYEAVLDTNPDYRPAMNGLSAVLIALGRLDEAEKLLSQDAPCTEHDWVSFHIRGMILLARGLYDSAVEHFEEGLAHVPFIRQRGIFRQSLALVQMRQLKFREAANSLMERRDALEQLLLVHCLGRLNELDRARTILAAVNDNVPPNVLEFKAELSAQIGLSHSKARHDEQWLFAREQEFILQAA